MRPSGETAAASVMTSPAPPTARAPRWTRCQSFARPFSDEYWHIGETPTRFGKVTERREKDVKRPIGTRLREPGGPARDVSRSKMVKLLLWLLLLVVCWPLALLALVAYPFLWLLAIPFRIVGGVLEGLVQLVSALFLFPARLLGGTGPGLTQGGATR